MIFVELKADYKKVQEIKQWLEQHFTLVSYEIRHNARTKTLTVAFKTVDDAINYSNQWT